MRRVACLAILLAFVTATAVAQQYQRRSGGQRTSGRSPTGNGSRRVRANRTTPRPDNGDLDEAPVALAANVPDLPTDFKVLLTRSIFSRDRSVFRPGGGTSSTQSLQLALRGTALQDGTYFAFLEDVTTHAIQQHVPGDSVAGGRIIAVTLDALTYEFNGRQTQVRLGTDLAGRPAPITGAFFGRGRNGDGNGAVAPNGTGRRGGFGARGNGGRFPSANGADPNGPATATGSNNGRSQSSPARNAENGPEADGRSFAPPDQAGGPPGGFEGGSGGPGFDGGPGGPPDFGPGNGPPPQEADAGPGPGGPPDGGPSEGNPGGPQNEPPQRPPQPDEGARPA